MNPNDVADLTDDERLLLVLCLQQRKAKTGTVRATADQICQRLGWAHDAYDAALGILVDIEAVERGPHGRVTVPQATVDATDGHAELAETASRLARSSAGARGSLRSKRLGDSGRTPPSPPTGGEGVHPSPLTSPHAGPGPSSRTRRRGEKNWTPYDLAGHFATRVTQFAAHSHVPPGVSNKKALASNFRTWVGEGLDASEIREVIDYFAANMARYVSDGIPVWKSFLARRAAIWADFHGEQPEVYVEDDTADSEWSLDNA